jgi:hypothetical protein
MWPVHHLLCCTKAFWISYRKLFHTSSGILCKVYCETKAQLSEDLGFSLKTDNTTQWSRDVQDHLFDALEKDKLEEIGEYCIP